MSNHVPSSTAVQGNTHRVMSVERVNVGGLTPLYTKNCRFQATLNTSELIIELTVSS